MTDRLDLLDYYTLLGLEMGAPADEIKASFHTFARRYHPDRFAAAPEDKRARAAQIYRRGTEGYGVLMNPQKRRVYDDGLRKGELRYGPDKQDAGTHRKGATVRKAVSPKARPFVANAQKAIKAQDWQTARLNLRIAKTHDPDHAGLAKQLAEVEEKLAK